MVVLTDGKNSYADWNEETREAAEEAAEEDVVVYTVGLGSDVSEGLLRDVADTTGGEYYHVGDAAELTGVFEQIAGDVKQEQYDVIDHKPVETTVRVDGVPEITFGEGGDVTSDFATGAQPVSVTPGSLLTVETGVHTCAPNSTVDTGVTDSNDGTTYNHTTCAPGTEHTVVTNASANRLTILEHGDPVPSVGPEWWQDDVETALGPYAEDGRVHFDAENRPHRAIVLVETGGEGASSNYALFLFEAQDTENPTYNESENRDRDDDGVPDDTDSCVYAPNTGADNDGDGVDNACDPTPNGRTDDRSDGSERPPIDSDVSKIRVE
jgi:hypothetical protein